MREKENEGWHQDFWPRQLEKWRKEVVARAATNKEDWYGIVGFLGRETK